MLAPLVSKELLSKLRTTFPAAPDRRMELREIDWQIGQQEVIEYLQQLHSRDEHDPLELGS